MRASRLIALVAVVALALSGTAAAATLGLNPNADVYPETQFEEDHLDVAVHDRETMGLLEYQNDSGEIQTIDAEINGTEAGELVSYRADQVEEPEFGEYPRKSDEANNSASALDASEWTTGGAASSKISVSQTDGSTAAGVTSIQIATDGSMTSGDVAYASYSNQSITTDVLKREAQLILNVDTLDSGAIVDVQIRDGDGDYVNATIDSSRDATAADVIANQTADGVVYQQKLGELSVEGTGDGSLDAIEEIRVNAEDADATVTLTAVNVEKKSHWDMGTTRQNVSDGHEDVTVEQNADGGRIELTSLSSMGEWSADSVIHGLRYHNLEYGMAEKPAAVNVTFSDAENYPSFPTKVEIVYTRELPTAYDLSHGPVSLDVTQTFLSDRYSTFRYAEGVGDTATADVADDSWIDLSGSLGEPEKEIEADATVQSGTTYKVQQVVLLTADQRDSLEATGGAGGFWGDSGGSNPLMSVYNWIAGGIVGLLSIVGIKARGS